MLDICIFMLADVETLLANLFPHCFLKKGRKRACVLASPQDRRLFFLSKDAGNGNRRERSSAEENKSFFSPEGSEIVLTNGGCAATSVLFLRSCKNVATKPWWVIFETQQQ